MCIIKRYTISFENKNNPYFSSPSNVLIFKKIKPVFAVKCNKYKTTVQKRGQVVFKVVYVHEPS